MKNRISRSQMLAYILGITKRGNKRITNRARFQRLQIWARGIRNRGSLRDFKSWQKDYKSGQRFHVRAKRFQVGKVIANRGKRCQKLGQGFQTKEGITNRCRKTYFFVQMSIQIIKILGKYQQSSLVFDKDAGQKYDFL